MRAVYIVFVALVVLVSAPGSVHARRVRVLQSTSALRQPPASPSPRSAAAYVDELFEDSSAAIKRLASNFTKRSSVAVVYVCFSRGDIINQALERLLGNEGVSEHSVIVSQDGGSNFTIDQELLKAPNVLFVHHPENLCPGLHHYFIRRFVFEVLGFEQLIVIEEDTVLHPQAIKMLLGMLELSLDDSQVGLVSITDMDNALLLTNTSRYANAILRTDIELGHLWAYGVHASRYFAVQHHLYDYYEAIKGHDYRTISVPPLSDAIAKLHAEKGFPRDLPLSQDNFFIFALSREGHRKRLKTLLRLFEPHGWSGLHIQQDPDTFFGKYGKGMYDGRIEGPPFEVTASREATRELEAECRERLDRIYIAYLGRASDSQTADSVVLRMLTGRFNAVELVRHIRHSAEYHRRMQELAEQ